MSANFCTKSEISPPLLLLSLPWCFFLFPFKSTEKFTWVHSLFPWTRSHEKNGWASPSIAWQKVRTNKHFRSQWAFLMSQRVDSWQSESLFPRSWYILLLKMLFLECRGSRMLFYAIFWRYVLSNTAVGWQHKQVSGTDWRSAQPVRKCDIALFLGKQKWLLGSCLFMKFSVTSTCFHFY